MYVCDGSPISFLASLTGALLLGHQRKRNAIPSLDQHAPLEIPVLTQGVCGQWTEHTCSLQTPHNPTGKSPTLDYRESDKKS